jgi:hypothetical protein
LVTVVLVSGWFAWLGYRTSPLLLHGDWGFFESGARSLVRYHGQSLYRASSLHLYANNPELQIGPPALLLVAAAESLATRTIEELFTGIIAALGVVSLLSAGHASRRYAKRTGGRTGWNVRLLGAGVLTIAIWSYQSAEWMHLDDALALTLVALAALLIEADQPWWAVAGLLGTAAAAKPWAVIFVALLIALRRTEISKALLVYIAAAAIWWLPFIVAAPNTIAALGQFPVFPSSGSVVYLLGAHGQIHGWLRPAQFVLGIAAGCAVGRERDWVRVPLAALAVRVVTDPYTFSYYGLGPLLFAYVYDAANVPSRRFPLATAVTAAVEFGLPWLHTPGALMGVARLAWGLGILFLVFRKTDALGRIRQHLGRQRGLGVGDSQLVGADAGHSQ